MDIHCSRSTDTANSSFLKDIVQESRNVEERKLKGAGEMLPEHDIPLDEAFSNLVLEQQDDSANDRRAKPVLIHSFNNATLSDISESGKKKVQFADAVGLNLACVKHFSENEESQSLSLPARHGGERLDDDVFTSKSSVTTCFVPAFKMPVETGSFDTQLQCCRVALEKVIASHFDIRGSVRALTSGCCRKEVGVRYTFNDWRSFMDAQASLASGAGNAEPGEHFEFVMYTPPILDVGSSVHFAVYCRTEHGEFWDNNGGRNYTLEHQYILESGTVKSDAV